MPLVLSWHDYKMLTSPLEDPRRRPCYSRDQVRSNDMYCTTLAGVDSQAGPCKVETAYLYHTQPATSVAFPVTLRSGAHPHLPKPLSQNAKTSLRQVLT
jgi:hypothetical protein